MNPNDRIYVAGHTGMLGSSIVRCLAMHGYTDIIAPAQRIDLRDRREVLEFFCDYRPAYVFVAAARVGGILANSTYPVDFIQDNLRIATNVIEHAWATGVTKLLFVGSSCIYPKLAPQPLKEEYLLTGPLEPTNQWYAIAKIAGIKLCQAYRRQYGFGAISALPTNLYGPGDNCGLQSSHVIPALIRKAHEAKVSGAKEMIVWGSGKPLREFMHVDDCARALVGVMNQYDSYSPINIGTGQEIEIDRLAQTICSVVGFDGRIVYDSSKPDGTPRKLLDISKLEEMGLASARTLYEGLCDIYRWMYR